LPLYSGLLKKHSELLCTYCDTMILVLQILIVWIVVFLRSYRLSGRHLRPLPDSGRRLIYIRPRGKYRSERFFVGITQASGIPFIIKQERWYHRLLKYYGVAVELQTSNDEFNKKYFIITDFPHHLKQLLASEMLLHDIQALLAKEHVVSIHATKNRLWCVATGYPRNYTKEDVYSVGLKQAYNLQILGDAFSGHYVLMTAIADQISKTSHYLGENFKSNRNLAFTFLAAHAALFCLGIFGWIFVAKDEYAFASPHELKDLMTQVGVALCAAWAVVIVILFKKTAWMNWVLGDFLLFGIIGIMLSAPQVIRALNIYLPQPPPAYYAMPVYRKICKVTCYKECGSHARKYAPEVCNAEYILASEDEWSPADREAQFLKIRGSNPVCLHNMKYEYSVEVREWDGSNRLRQIRIPSAVFDSLKPGDEVNILVFKGALGISWMDIGSMHVK
jgi:hypothetical protein